MDLLAVLLFYRGVAGPERRGSEVAANAVVIRCPMPSLAKGCPLKICTTFIRARPA